MGRVLLLKIILIVIWLATSAAQPFSPPTDTTDAYSILQGKYKEGCVPDGDVQAIGEELRAIRKAVPEVAGVHDSGRYVPQQLILSLAGLWSPPLGDEAQKARIQRMTSNPLATGIGKLDDLNRRFGAVRIGDQFLGGDWVLIHFGKPLDMGCVAEAYNGLLGEQVQPNHIMGDGDHIYRAQKKGEPVHYVFRIGSGDCPAGCINETLYYFNLHADGTGYRISRVDGPQPHHSLWGYPHRFPLRIFESFDDLVKKTESADWSLRVHAVSALGRVYASRGSGLGEDTFADRDGDPTLVKRTATIIDQINKNPAAVKRLLDRMAAQDPDEDVKRIAKSALLAQGRSSRKQ